MRQSNPSRIDRRAMLVAHKLLDLLTFLTVTTRQKPAKWR
jgi:hypothetical protein